MFLKYVGRTRVPEGVVEGAGAADVGVVGCCVAVGWSDWVAKARLLAVTALARERRRGSWALCSDGSVDAILPVCEIVWNRPLTTPAASWGGVVLC